MSDYVSAMTRVQVLEAEIHRLRAEMERAVGQLEKFGYKGPKQIGRALITLDRALSLGVEG